MNKHEEETMQHESFGQLIFTRVNCNPSQSFYGSELQQSHYIQMTLEESYVNRTLADEKYYTTGKILARVRMSSGQFAEMITSLNRGSGTPVTVEVIDGKIKQALPNQESRKEFVHRKFQDRMKEFGATIRLKQQEAKEIVKKKTLSKDDMRNLTNHLEWLTGEVERNIPFFAECFQETMDEVVFEAKTEVENAIQHKINALGIESLNQLNNLIEKK